MPQSSLLKSEPRYFLRQSAEFNSNTSIVLDLEEKLEPGRTGKSSAGPHKPRTARSCIPMVRLSNPRRIGNSKGNSSLLQQNIAVRHCVNPPTLIIR